MVVIKKVENGELRLGGDNRVYCTCPAWLYQRKPITERKPCKHMLELVNAS